MSYESNIAATDHLFAGEDKTLSYEVFAAGSTTVMENVTGFALQWTMTLGSKNVLTKTTSVVVPNPGGITITGVYNAVRATNTQRVLIAIADTDTEALAAGRYQCALKRLDGGLEAILSHGYAELQAAVIR